MTAPVRTFAVATDEALVDLIERARKRLVIIAPAVSLPVAIAIARRFPEVVPLDMTVVLDSDPEVYRLGFGDLEALETIRAASATNQFDLREQAGVRIGVVISDEMTMVYSPISKTIEAGSTSVEKPNAIFLSGSAAEKLAIAAGVNAGEETTSREVGTDALDAAKVHAMQSNLKANPPGPFDIARKLNVFTSKVQYVEFSASNYRLTTKQIPLPPELVDVADEDLKKRIVGRMRAPFEGIGKIKIAIEHDGKSKTLEIDDEWLRKERKRIEDEYTFQIDNFGRVIFSTDRDAFEKAADRFKLIVEKYQVALGDQLFKRRAEFEKQIVDEFTPRWKQSPPSHFARWGIAVNPDSIKDQLQRLADEIFERAVTFEPPRVKIQYKNVALENIRDSAFLDALKGIMLKKRVPRAVVDSLFETGHAAPETGAFL